jgi:HPt (histidine-containing phosphotransfer) domain-containing protein
VNTHSPAYKTAQILKTGIDTPIFLLPGHHAPSLVATINPLTQTACCTARAGLLAQFRCNEMEHVNNEKINELRYVLGDHYHNLLDTFYSNAYATLLKLNQLCEVRDQHREEIVQLAHSLKGIAGNIGASSMHTYAIQLEKLARERDLTVMPELMTAMMDALEAFRSLVVKKAS